MHILIQNSEQIEIEIFASCHTSNILWNLFQDILNNILRPGYKNCLSDVLFFPLKI